MKFCEIPEAQNVLIGSEDGQSNEKPVKGRNFSKFHIGKFEVTQLQYKAVTGQEPWKGKSFVQEGDNNPAVYVTYNEAKQFAHVLSLIDPSATYRLPTEAEWEYAARGVEFQNASRYWGDDFDGNFAFYWGNSEDVAEYARPVNSCPSPNPEYCANDYGLMHVLGNVWEWTGDAYMYNYANASTNGHIAVKGNDDSNRVIRGGAWLSLAKYVQSANRNYDKPDGRFNGVGFRLVRMPK